jgi:hypothetical protein
MEPEGRPEDAVFIRDGFSVFGLVLPLVWLVWNRLWFAALAVVGLTALAAAAGWHWGFAAPALATELLISLFVALEGATLRMAALEGKGYRQSAIVHAETYAEAELRYFADYAPGDRPVPSALPAAPGLARSGGVVASQAAFAFPSHTPARG